MDRCAWIVVGDIRLNILPELESFVRRNPSQIHPTIRHNEVHGACPQKFFNIALANVPDAPTVQRALLVPEFGERQLCDYPLVRSQRNCL
jgi:hypothetical protein